MTDKTAEALRRGKPETRSHFDRAKDDFEAAKGSVRFTERIDTEAVNGGCPTCHAPMTLRHEYKEPNHYHFAGVCSADAEHNLERYGYYSTEGS